MQVQKALKTEARKVFHCPRCGSEKIWRIQRSVPEKIIFYISGQKYAARKYQCSACNSAFLIHRDDRQPEQGVLLLNGGTEHLIACPQCGRLTLTINKVSEGDTVHAPAGKTPFRKLICFHCRHETIIYKEDYEAANGNEL